MSDAPKQPYTRSPQPTLPDSQRLYLENELKKLEAAFRALAEIINTKQDKP
jgi:hypothetical protein